MAVSCLVFWVHYTPCGATSIPLKFSTYCMSHSGIASLGLDPLEAFYMFLRFPV